ncbi:MAG: histidine phosphatase family protein [Dehalococcoidia bacterium]
MDTIAELLVVRHGETPWNEQGRIQGHMDIDLNARGRHQASLLASRLRGCGVDAIHSSDLVRAASTASILGQSLGLTPSLSPRWRELGLGDLEGQESRVSPLEFGELISAAANSVQPLVPGAETFASLEARLLEGLADLHVRHPGATVCLVTHGGAGKVLMAHLIGLPPGYTNRLSMRGNCGLSKIDFRGGRPQLTLLNDTSHLAGVPS